MAFLNVMKVSVLIVLILSVHVSSWEAVNYPGRKTMQKRIKSSSVLRELGFILSKMKQSKRRAMTATATDKDRVAPGGPDHMNNTAPPAMHV
jgi:hypothetical protein